MAYYYSKAHICQCLSRLSTLRRTSVVTISGKRQKTGEQFVDEVLRLANQLLQLGLRNGEVVAICGFNSEWYLEWLLAVAFVGGIVAPLNYRWNFEEAKSAFSTINPVMLVADESCSHWCSLIRSNAIPSLRWHFFLDSSSLGVLKSTKMSMAEAFGKHITRSFSLDYSWAPDDAVIICFTSGTTGRPKGVIISHSSLIVQSLAKVAIVGYTEDDVYLHTAPLCHIGALSSAMAMLMVGARHVLIPKFKATLVVDSIEQQGVTSFITVPAILSDLISLTRENETWAGRQSVKKILNGGGTLPDELIKDAAKIFPRAKLLSAYGMTETCSSLTFKTLHDPTSEASTHAPVRLCNGKDNSVYQPPSGVCVGKPAPHVELKISSESSSQTGRILTRGPHAMLGYWDQKIPANALNSTNEIWLDTGDIGSMDECGSLWLVGRVNGRIKSGGENVHPEEVEAILLKHPGVIAAVTVGIPDRRLTEKVTACIKLRESWQWTDNSSLAFAENKQVLCKEILQNFCREKNLTGFKVPKVFILWKKPFPLTSTGKIRRDQVRKEAISVLQSFPSSNL
ncbi:hypothetical protein K2173_000302 [Erythroxylum novogranatense]|uniref:4-coumarate--CoA ligase n=1 Tax=Erythroxylum novogranatense TaxID=1862640 RepID=A0AAV8SWS9_9ROSI|nr:hypothetical protein K2173_000302 [Erythroxylum novogranatense]